MWFRQNDPSIPEEKRQDFRRWGLPGDEFTDNGHLPYEIYVQETRRIMGRRILTENDFLPREGFMRPRPFADSIAFTYWYMDSHSCTPDVGTWGAGPGMCANAEFPYDGKLILSEEFRPGMIPYRALVPENIDNLLVSVCISSTHIAWGSIRLEPTWIHLGEVAGLAASQALTHNEPVAQLDVMKNLLFIHCDVLHSDVFLHRKCPFLKTPNMDRLAKQSTAFENAFVQYPTYVPSRASFITGMYPQQLGVFNHGYDVPKSIPTLPDRLNEVGYQSVAFGRTHRQHRGCERFPRTHREAIFPMMETARLIRTENWKLCVHTGRSSFGNYPRALFHYNEGELYDLKNDPGEKRNLYYDAGYTEIRWHLARQLLEHEIKIQHKMGNSVSNHM